MLVHKEHCKKLARAKKLEEEEGKVSSRVPVGIYSHHPFPRESLPEDTAQILTVQAHRILIKMRMSLHFEHAGSKMQKDLLELEKAMEWSRRIICRERKIRPPPDSNYPLKVCKVLMDRSYRGVIPAETFADLWSTLFLLVGRWLECDWMRSLNSLKDPRNAVPLEMWEGLEEEVGLFPARLKELTDTLVSAQLPSFKELLRVYCGGSLEQNCSCCGTAVTIEAVVREVKGWQKGVPAVCLLPFMPILFCCGQPTCSEGFISPKLKAWDDWSLAVDMTKGKLEFNRCDYCFKLAENVHRWPEFKSKFVKYLLFQVRQVSDQDLVQQGLPGAWLGGKPQGVLLSRHGGEESEGEWKEADCCWV